MPSRAGQEEGQERATRCPYIRLLPSNGVLPRLRQCRSLNRQCTYTLPAPMNAPDGSGRQGVVQAGGGDQKREARKMKERTDIGQEIETALGEVLVHVRGETALSCRIVDDPSAGRIVALRKRLKLSRQKFADRFGLDVRARAGLGTGPPGSRPGRPRTADRDRPRSGFGRAGARHGGKSDGGRPNCDSVSTETGQGKKGGRQKEEI